MERVRSYGVESGEESSAAEPRRQRRLADRLFYTPVHDRNINSVKLLVDTVLPVRYSPDFYKKLMLTPYDFTKMGTSTSHW